MTTPTVDDETGKDARPAWWFSGCSAGQGHDFRQVEGDFAPALFCRRCAEVVAIEVEGETS